MYILLSLALIACVQAIHHINNVKCNPTGSAAPPQHTLTTVRTASVNVSGYPFQALYVNNGTNALYSLTQSGRNGSSAFIGILDTTTFPPSTTSTIKLPAPYVYGIALSNDQQYLYAASGEGVYVVNVAKAIAGQSAINFLNGTTSTQAPGNDAFQVTVQGNRLIVAQEDGEGTEKRGLGNTPGDLDIIVLSNSSYGQPLATIPLGYLIAGTAATNTTVYAVSEETEPSGVLPGFISILGLPLNVQSSVFAGCSPVRVLPAGDVVWATARGSNLLLAFNASRMITTPNDALLRAIHVGTAPVDLAFAKNNTRILVANSNRFLSAPFGSQSISVIDVEAALQGRGAHLGVIPTGLFPRELTLSPDGMTMLVTDYNSSAIQAIDIRTIP